MAELLVLDQCLEIIVETNIQNVIIEANSELVIKVAKNIQIVPCQIKCLSTGSCCRFFTESKNTYKSSKL